MGQLGGMILVAAVHSAFECFQSVANDKLVFPYITNPQSCGIVRV